MKVTVMTNDSLSHRHKAGGRVNMLHAVMVAA